MSQVCPRMELGVHTKVGTLRALHHFCQSPSYLLQPVLIPDNCIGQLQAKPLRTGLTRTRQEQCFQSRSNRSISQSQPAESTLASFGVKRRRQRPALSSKVYWFVGSWGWNADRIRNRPDQAQSGGRCRSQSAVGGVRSSSDYVRVSSTLQTDIPFPELNGVPLEQYMTETQRIFAAVFPDTHRAQRLSPEVWRIFMLPINFLFLSVRPVVDMRVWVHDPAKDGPSPGSMATAGKAKKLVCLEAVRCELKGLDYVLKPDDFILGANGALHPEKTGAAARMKGSMHVSVSLAIPPALTFTPKGLLESAGNAVMEQILHNMKDKVNSQILLDYRAYAREEAIKRTRQ